MTVDSGPSDLAAYVLAALHAKKPGAVSKALGLNKEATMAIALGLASRGTLALAESNLSALRALMGETVE